jgi:hypothetical protein
MLSTCATSAPRRPLGHRAVVLAPTRLQDNTPLQSDRADCYAERLHAAADKLAPAELDPVEKNAGPCLKLTVQFRD